MTILKKTILPLVLVFLSIGLTHAQTTTDPLPYCAGSYGNNGCSTSDYIRSFTFGTLSNLNTPCTPFPYYIRYLPIGNQTGTFTPGLVYSLTITGDASKSNGFAVWIDYNQNLNFNDAGEMIYSTSVIQGNGFIYSANVTIPLSATNGNTRLRVRSNWNNSSGSFLATDACVNKTSDWGEIEDYQITIGTPPPPPVLGPLPVITSISPTSANVGSSVTLLGNNFSTNPTDNIVSFGTKRALVTSASATSLTATVPVGVTGSQLSVLRNGLVGTSSQSFVNSFSNSTSINSTTSFAAPTTLLSLTSIDYLEPVDLDNDGRLDLVGIRNGWWEVYVWRNLGNPNPFSTGAMFASPVTISLTSPNHIKVADMDGDGKQDFVITSNNFSTGVTIFYNNIPNGTTTFTNSMFSQTVLSSATTTNFSSEVADLDGDGKLDVAIANIGTNTITVHRNIGWPGNYSFASAQTFTVGSSPLMVKAADIDNDNKPELLAICNGSNVMSVLKNTSSGSGISFNATVNIGLLSSCRSIDIDDIDNDGRKDVVVAYESFSGSLSIFRNAGLSGIVSTSSFNTRFDLTMPSGVFSREVRLAELNGDGKLDMILVGGGASTIYVWQNNSTSGVINSSSFGTRQDLLVSSSVTSIVCADFDNDGRNDLICSNSASTVGLKNNMSIFSVGNLASSIYATGSLVSVPFTITLPITPGNIFTAQLSDSSGSFNSPVSIGSSIGTSSGVISATIPNSTIPGLNYRIRVVSLLPFYTSDIASQPFRILTPPVITGISPLVAAPGAAITLTGNNFSATAGENIVYFGGVRATVVSASTTSLVVNVPLTAQAAPVSVTIIGFTGISSSIFTPSFSGSTGLTSTNFSTPISFGSSGIPQAGQIELIDADLNGRNDVVIPNNGPGTTTQNHFFRNISTSGINSGSFAPRVGIATAGNAFQTLGVDIDGDGQKDVVTVSSSTAVLSIQKNVSTGGSITFQTRQDFTTASACTGIAYGDLDGDGKLDLVTTNFSTNNMSVFRNLAVLGAAFSSITLATRADFATGNAPVVLTIHDLDGDNKPDVVIANGNPTNTLTVLKNTSSSGSISFAAPITITTTLNPRGLALGDLNNDGKPDILLANQSSGNISVFENQSTSSNITFGTRIDLTVGSNPSNIAAGDINGDGKLDIAVTNLNSNTVNVIANNHTSGSLLSSSFATPVSLTASSQPNGVAITDIDGDLRPDLLVSLFGSGSMLVFANNSPRFTINSISGQLCAGNILNITYNAGLAFTLGNIFTAQLSDSVGNFSSPVNIGSSLSITSGTIAATIPANASNGFGYRIRLVSTAPAFVSNDNQFNLTILKCPVITSVTPNNGVVGTTVTVTGNNFSTIPSNNIVYFGGVRSAVTSSTGTSMVTTIPNGAAYRPLSVNVNGAIVQSPLAINTTFNGGNAAFSSSSFENRSSISVSNSVIGNAAGDLDGDGKPDLVSGINGAVVVYKNNNTVGSLSASNFTLALTLSITGQAQYVRLGDMDGDGRLDIVLIVGNNNTVIVFRNTTVVGGNISFQTGIILAAQSFPTNLVLTDLDNDAKLDIAVTHVSVNSMSIFKNNALPGNIDNLSFGNRVDIAVPASAGIASTDLNADGRMDLIITNQLTSAITCFINNGTGISAIGFNSFTLTAAANALQEVIVADFDNDNRNDLAAVSNGTSGIITIFKNNYTSGIIGASSFTTSNFSSNSTAISLAACDLDGDNRIDLVATNSSSSGAVTALRNITTSSGVIAFDPKFDLPTSSTNGGTRQVEVVDLNGDNKPDVVTGSLNNFAIYIWRNTTPSYAVGSVLPGPYCSGSGINIPFTVPPGMVTVGNIFTAQLSDSSGSFTSPTSIGSLFGTAGGTISGILPANVTGGTNYRIRVVSTLPAITSEIGTGTINVLRCPLITSITPLTAQVGDTLTINGNNFGATPSGNIVYLGGSAAVVLTASESQLKVRVPKGATASAVSLTVGNFSVMGNQTFTPTYSGNTVLSASSFDTRAEVLTGVTSVRSIGLVDLNQDNKLDLLAALSNGTSLNVYRNASAIGAISTSSFAAQTGITTQSQPWGQVSADFDNDGKLDLAVVNLGANSVSIYRNTSISATITFGSRLDIATGTSPYAITAGDIDGDGKLDIGVANLGSNTISILRNTTTSTTLSFATAVDFAVPNQPSSLVITDLDGDFKADVAVTNFGSNQVSIFRNTASLGIITAGSLGSRVDFGTAAAPFSIEGGDIDGDGKIDLIVPNFSANSFSVFRNTSSLGSITFATRADVSTPAGTNSVALGDMDGDTRLDVVTANNQAGNISIFRNTAGVGSVGFATAITMAVQSSPVRVLVADIDGDDRPDIAVSNSGSNSVSVFRNINKAPEPTIQASNITFTKLSEGVYRVSCTKGNGARRIFIGRQSAAVVNNPVDENEYLGTASFPFGSQIGTGGVAYVGADSSVVVTLPLPLGAPIDYHFRVYEFNGSGGSSNYLITNPLAGLVSVPVVLVSFDATYIGDDKVSLKWVTSSEVNNKGFYVQRSIDNENWSDVTFVAGKINSKNINTYNFADDVSKLTNNNVIYYRLKQVDLDAKETILPTRVVRLSADMNIDVEWSVWPNPTDNEVYIKANNTEQFTYELYNTTGNLVMKSNVLATEVRLDLSNTEHGIYYLKLTTATGTSYHKVVKQ